jgi:hypothetical protein
VAAVRRRVAEIIASSLLLLAAGASARAGDHDLVLSRLGTLSADGTQVIPSTSDYRSLVSELGVVLAPPLGAPAETLGFGGFQFSADLGFTGIASNRQYWRALHSSPDPLNPNVSHGDSMLTTLGAFVRKGLWLPLPSFEIGVGGVQLLDSGMWAAQAYGKVALVEGYTDAPWPSFAFRAGVSRLMGQSDLDLTVVSFDASVSKQFGVAGAVTVSPYFGYNVLLIIPRSEVIDKTPQIDALTVMSDVRKNFVFPDQDAVTRHRLFLGAKASFYIVSITMQMAYAFAGSSRDSSTSAGIPCPSGPTTMSACDAHDDSNSQFSLETALALEF